MENILGTKLADRYLIEDMVGVGGMCNVYRAFDSVDLRTVAIKMLRDEYAGNEEFLRRFRNESKAINALSHPNIVKIYDVVLDTSNPYLIMEYVDGITLKEYIERKKVVAPRTAANIIGLVLTALQCAHENGIVHRDVKPQNIMVTSDGHVKVMDFGIARFAMSQSRTIDGNAIGSVHYISPEQARGGAVDQRADIYSVGVILFELLSGRLPFNAESPISVALQQIEETPQPLRSLNPDVPAGLEQITIHAMAKDPDDRYTSCTEMIHDLKSWIANPKATFAYAVQKKAAAKEVKNKDMNHSSKKKGFHLKKPTTFLSKLFAVTCGVVVVSLLFVFVMFQVYDPFSSVADFTMPNLVGVDYETAAASSAYSDLKIKLESEDYNADYDAGQIYYQSPSAGKSVKIGSTVYVRVSAGAKMIPIPSFVNQEATAVYSKLVSLGLKYSVSEIASDTIAEGSVVRTSPEAGSSVAYGSTVIVYISVGSDKEPTTVPDVLGFPEAEAVNAIKAASFEAYVTYQKTTIDKVGVVISQSPAHPSQVSIGSRITLVVGSEDDSATGTTTVTLQTVPPALTGFISITAVMNGEEVFSDTIEPENTRLISIPLKGTGTCMVDILVDGTVFKSASVDFDKGQYYWTADYSAGFTD